jgi:hypothetical protein
MTQITFTPPSDGTTATAASVTTPLNAIKDVVNGNLDNDNIKANAGISGSKLAATSIDAGAKLSYWDGWVSVTDAWTYASATTITVPSDATTKYSIGDKIKLTQTTVKYFYITAVAATTLTITGGSDYTLVNAAITGVYFSKMATPLGFPDWLNYTPTWGGFSAAPTLTFARFKVNGRECIVNTRDGGGGTSNTTGLTISLPITARTITDGAWDSLGAALDNGTWQTSAGIASVSTGGTVANIYRQIITGSWTNSGLKGWIGFIRYEI